MNFKDIFIDGKWTPTLSGDWMDIENPGDKSIIARVPAAGKEDINRAIESAQIGQKEWDLLGPDIRQEKVAKMIDYLIDKFEQIAPVLSKELGCTESFALSRHLEAYRSAMLGFLEDHKKIQYIQERKHYTLYRRPQGLVALLTPWNYPFGQIVKKVIPALLAGNAVLLKPSRSTPMTAYFWAQAALEAQLPPGVFSLLPGRGSEVGNILAQDPRIQAISFTGSTKGGKEVGNLALSSSLKRLTLELGGKSAALVLEGSKTLSEDLKGVLDSVYLNVGQTCSAKTRLIIPKKEKAQIEEILIQLSKSYKFGNPLEDQTIDVGVLHSEKQLNKVKSYIELGLEEGAKILYSDPSLEKGPGYQIGPTIFTDVDPNMAIAQEEIFGPVLCIITYKTLEEAIDICNNSIYGLGGMVFGPNKEEAIKVASQIKTGQVQVNGAIQVQRAPFGGFKESGIGREGALEGLEEFYEYQTIFI